MKLKQTKIGILAATLTTFGLLAGGANATISTITDDFTDTGVIVVDNSTSTHSFTLVTDPIEVISAVSIVLNLSDSAGSINSDGTVDNAGGNSFLNELAVTLISPTGTELLLIAAGDYSSGGVGNALVDLTFQDGGSAASGDELTTGTFSASGGSFSIFDGETASGTYQIRIEDNTGSDPKSLNGFTLNVETGSIPEPSSSLLLGIGVLTITCRRKRTV